jgi:3',5'-nucleoside bisphosphate phosphatase
MTESDRTLHADFHTHSTASDGTLTPVELIHESARRGLLFVAVTDHDTTAGLETAIAAGVQHGVAVIPGIEFSAESKRGELHILGYGIDPDNERLQSRISELRQSRLRRSEKILERLHDLGIPLNPDVIRRTGANDSTGRPHIARALVEIGVAVTVDDAFERYLAAGKPAFVGKELISPAEAIDLINEAGGIAVMAHPFSVPDLADTLPRLIGHGLAGLECYYGEYDDHQRHQLALMARQYQLLPTGGSDYHGPGFREGRDLGSVTLPEAAIVGMISRIGWKYV